MGSKRTDAAVEKVRELYTQWLGMDKKQRERAELPQSDSAFAREYSVDRTTLWRWKKQIAEALEAVEGDELAIPPEDANHPDKLWEKVLLSFPFFVMNFVMMWKKEGGDPIKFKMWGFQKDAARRMQFGRKLIFLKARQMGLSWLAMAYALWCVMTKKNFHVYVTSIGLKEVQEQMNRIRFIYYNLPEWMQEKAVLGGRGRKDNDSIMEFSTGSAIHAIASRSSSGHGSAPGLYILDELARKERDVMMWRAVKPSIGKHTQVFAISTSNGLNNLFANLWFDAQAGNNDFEPVFYAASEHPDYTPEYLEEMKKDFAGDLQGYMEAFPMKPEDAFLSSSRSIFDIQVIRHWKEVNRMSTDLVTEVGYLDIDDAGKPKWVVDERQRFVVWKKPEKGHRYCMGVDVAEGLTHGDWSVAVVLDVNTREVVAMLRAKWAQEALMFPVLQLCRWYNDAYIVVEVNKGADLLVSDLKTQVGHLLYCRPVRANIWDKPTLVPGFYTGGTNKSRIILQLRRWFTDMEHPLRIYSDIILDEMGAYEDNDGTLEAAQGYFDDCVMALALAVEGTNTMPTQNASLTSKVKWDFGKKERSWRSL